MRDDQHFDVHTLNFDRVTDSGLVKIWLGNSSNFYLNFNRFTKKGDSVTTIDINRIEFEFDKPTEEESKDITVGLNVNFENRYTFVIEQKFQEYDTTNSMFLPGFADGGSSSSYPSSLNYFFLNQPYSLDSSSQRLQFNARPFNFLLFAGSIQLMKQEMDLSYSEGADGTTYLGRIFSYNKNGSGNFDRNINLYNLDTTLLLTHKLAIVGAFRYSTFEQTGNFLIVDTSEDAALDYKNLDFEGGLQYQFSPEFSLTAGYRNETRTLNEGIETVDFEDKTQKNSFFGNLKLDIKRKLKLTADYQL